MEHCVAQVHPLIKRLPQRVQAFLCFSFCSLTVSEWPLLQQLKISSVTNIFNTSSKKRLHLLEGIYFTLTKVGFHLNHWEVSCITGFSPTLCCTKAGPSTRVLPNTLSKLCLAQQSPLTRKSHGDHTIGPSQGILLQFSEVRRNPAVTICWEEFLAGGTLQAPVKHQPLDKTDQASSLRLNPLWRDVISLTRGQSLVTLAAHLSPAGCLMVGGDFHGLNP